jgi:hypothetical protein
MLIFTATQAKREAKKLKKSVSSGNYPVHKEGEHVPKRRAQSSLHLTEEKKQEEKPISRGATFTTFKLESTGE